MATLYENLQGGTITDNPLTSGATTINSSAFQYLPVVSGSDIMYITLDPDGSAGAPEIVKITAHTAAATSVTVVRAQQDTSARSHVTGTEWIHGLTDADVAEFLKTVDTANITDSAVTTAKIADANVTTAKIADANVTTAKLDDGAVTTAKLGADSVTGAKIADDTVDSEHYVAGSIDNEHLADSAVDTAEIADGAVTFAKLDATAWTDVTFQNSWVNYGGSEQNVQYRKVGDMVQLRGAMKSGTMSATAFTLPTGYRPPSTIYVGVPSNNGHGQVGVYVSGSVFISVGSNVSCHFDGIQFSVTA